MFSTDGPFCGKNFLSSSTVPVTWPKALWRNWK